MIDRIDYCNSLLYMTLLLQSSRSCRELKTTSPVSSVSSADVFTLDRY